MNRKIFILAVSVIILIYAGLHFYIYTWLDDLIVNQLILWPAFVFFAVSFWISRLLENRYPSPLSAIFTWAGALWTGLFSFLLWGFLSADALRLIIDLLLPENGITGNWHNAAGWYFLALALLLSVYSFFNAANPRVKKIKLTIKRRSPEKNMRITWLSDIHAGTIIGKKRIAKMTEKIQSTNPDMVIIAGDLVNEDIDYCAKYDCAGPLRSLKPKRGVYVISGNHEYIAGIEKARKYIKTLGVRFLEDETIVVDDLVLITGRKDRNSSTFANSPRKTLNELNQDSDKNLPRILLDHQPFKLEEAVKEGYDLQLSGHVHHGQLFPYNFITKLVYEKSWGYLKKGDTHFYVSSGAGTWGPPMRLGNHPEIMVFDLTFDENL